MNVSKNILKRRVVFNTLVFALGTATLAIVVVPITAFYLRSWRIILYYISALVLVAIVQVELFGGLDHKESLALTLLISIPFNVAYAYAVVYQLKGEAKKAIKELEADNCSFSSSTESIDVEQSIIKALDKNSSMTVGHISAEIGCSALDIESELMRLVEMNVIARRLLPNNSPIYHLI